MCPAAYSLLVAVGRYNLRQDEEIISRVGRHDNMLAFEELPTPLHVSNPEVAVMHVRKLNDSCVHKKNKNVAARKEGGG